MNKATHAWSELQAMDALSALDSPVHRLHPLAKLLCTIAYILITVSFHKYDLSGIIVLVLYPLFLFLLSGISVGPCLYKMRYVLPLVMAVGIVNPFLDRAIVLEIGGIPIRAGIISMLTLMLKGVFSLMASFLLIATTSIDTLCAALRMLHVPDILTTLLLLTYRYIGVMLEEVSIMTEAYALRAPGQKGIHISAWGSFLGQLLLRSMDRAEALYHSMLLRGFRGEYYYAEVPPCGVSGMVYTIVCCAAFLCARWFNLPALLGSLFVR